MLGFGCSIFNNRFEKSNKFWSSSSFSIVHQECRFRFSTQYQKHFQCDIILHKFAMNRQKTHTPSGTGRPKKQELHPSGSGIWQPGRGTGALPERGRTANDQMQVVFHSEPVETYWTLFDNHVDFEMDPCCHTETQSLLV